MGRTIFGKLMLTYLSVILITLAVLAVLLSLLFQSYYFYETEQTLITHGQQINNLVLKYLNDQITRQELEYAVKTLDRALNAEIWIVDAHGNIYFDSRPFEEQWFGNYLEGKEIEQLKKAEIITRIGRFGNRFNLPVITVGVPLFIDQEVQGAIFLHSPVFGVKNALKPIYRIIWLAALIAVIFAALVNYYISRKFSRPLQELSRAALQVASGKFEEKVEVLTSDEIGHLAKTFNYMAEELGKLERMRQEFIANVSHELRSPLTSIRGFIQGILDGTITGQHQERYLKIVFEETNRLTRLVNDLLDLARLESGSISMNWSNFDVNELIREVVAKLEPQIREKQLQIELSLEERPTWAYADRDRVEQVLINLLDNAIRFTPEGKKIKLEAVPDGDKIVVAVTDQGIGIPPEELPYIWQRFHKVDKARTRSKGGTGLGLAIVKRIIEALGQTISVESELNRGSRFSFTLSATKG
ncbi:sensor histidine kinase [Calderihabitans maritimus]|uniref:histidine kinase n=1 Tax=Calderihabitans maritimus TaxID=1246530 RepID=A0A1Z5HSC6_9FIRM|nr:HAMP domain-containing sensor histidine kinase [Calderihabitans maritimus]GAW92231.1 integral membrane sensor signal transduction histidine kinase [Calderihabitans maritimus]